MEPEGSLPSSQELSTCTYPAPNKSSPQHSILSLKGTSEKKNILLNVVTGIIHNGRRIGRSRQVAGSMHSKQLKRH
jgi:hypothetical protein